MKTGYGIFFAILLLCSLSTVQDCIILSKDTIEEGFRFSISEATPHGQIVISHNDNFTTEGWAGNGTVDDPYTLSDFEIAVDGVCINISNTDAYFVIENCYLLGEGGVPSGIAIALESVQNGIIRDLTIVEKPMGVYSSSSSDITISNVTTYEYEYAVYLSSSTDCYITDSNFLHCSEATAIALQESDHCKILSNKIVGNRIGILCNSSTWIELANNTIVGNSVYGIQSTSGTKKLTVYWNRVGWNGQNAIDNGSTKFWDDGTYGNWWNDCSDDTAYLISGTAKAKDRHPQLWTDSNDPESQTQLYIREMDETYTIEFISTVTDNVAVKEVILSRSLDNASTWQNITMDWSYGVWTTNVEDLAPGSTVQYRIYANDYAGNWDVTTPEMYSLPELTQTDTVPTNGTVDIDNVFLAILIVSIVSISIIAILAYQYPSKLRWRK